MKARRWHERVYSLDTGEIADGRKEARKIADRFFAAHPDRTVMHFAHYYGELCGCRAYQIERE